jgi:toxin YoeB
MARKVIWTKRAQQERKDILDFWIDHNKSTAFSKKLNQLFRESIRLIKLYPGIGRLTDIDNVRVKVVRNYFIFYELVGQNIYILSVWNSKQDPEELKL